MTRSASVITLAFGMLAFSGRDARAQVTVEPSAPRWGESITITLEPNRGTKEDQRVDASDQPYALLSLTWKGAIPSPERLWAPMTWNGRRFTATIALTVGCDSGVARIYTAERVVIGATAGFLCRTADGQVVPGARLSSIVWGDRDRSNWKAEAAEDMAALKTTADRGWEYAVLWTHRWATDRAAFPPADLLAEVHRVEQKESIRTPGLLFSLFRGYDLAGQQATAFERLKELCERYPESEFTARDAIPLGTAAALVHPEFAPEMGRLMALVASRAPENKGLRWALSRLVANVPAVPLSTIRQISTAWMREHPEQMAPYYFLALALSNAPSTADQQKEVDALVSRAIDLSLRPHPFEFSEVPLRQKAFELRSRFRAAHDDLAGAVADARMAQLVARDKAGAEDMSMEAGLWQQLGYSRKAEGLALEAFNHGSLEAETLLKTMYVSRTGADAGFQDYLVARLRAVNATPAAALRPTPAFSATTIDGAAFDVASLSGHVTVLDFWFINCPPCRVERPKLNDLVTEFGDKVRFVGFALDSKSALESYRAEFPFKYEVVPSSDATAKAFGVNSYPTHMVIDRAGRIVWLSAGDDDRVDRLRAMLVRVLAQ